MPAIEVKSFGEKCGLGTNAGLKRMHAEEHGASYKDLLYVRRRFITKDHMRDAIRRVVNAIFRVRHPHIWGEGTTACASDSKKFGAWDQNPLVQKKLTAPQFYLRSLADPKIREPSHPTRRS